MRIRKRIMAVFVALVALLTTPGMWEMRAYAASSMVTSNQIVLEN